MKSTHFLENNWSKLSQEEVEKLNCLLRLKKFSLQFRLSPLRILSLSIQIPTVQMDFPLKSINMKVEKMPNLNKTSKKTY